MMMPAGQCSTLMLPVSLIVASHVDDGVDDGAGRDGDQVRQEVEIDSQLSTQHRQNDKETD
jgi:hypothetical protein